MLVDSAGRDGPCSTLDGIDGKCGGGEDSAGGANREVSVGGTGNTIDGAGDEAGGAGTTELPGGGAPPLGLC